MPFLRADSEISLFLHKLLVVLNILFSHFYIFLFWYLINNKETYVPHFTEKVPSVLLVLEGGLGTIKQVLSACKQKIPVVVIKGSGRGADILAYAYENLNDDYLKNDEKEHEDLMYLIQNNLLESYQDDSNCRKNSVNERGETPKDVYKDIISCIMEKENVSLKIIVFCYRSQKSAKSEKQIFQWIAHIWKLITDLLFDFILQSKLIS